MLQQASCTLGLGMLRVAALCAHNRCAQPANLAACPRNLSAYIVQEGYRTLVGEGSGTIVSYPLLLQLSLARALVRRPKLLLLDDADQFAAAVGLQRLVGVLRELQEQQGVTLVMVAAKPADFVSAGLRAALYHLEEGQLYQR